MAMIDSIFSTWLLVSMALLDSIFSTCLPVSMATKYIGPNDQTKETD